MKKLTVLFSLLSLGMPMAATAQPSVFVYSGELSQSSHSPEDSWFKEVELADVDEDGWLDIVLPQKQPCLSSPCNPVSGSNIDHLYLNQPGLVLSLDSPSMSFDFRPTVGTFPIIDTVRNYDVEVADLDHDGNLDIVRPDYSGELKVLWGAGDGTFLQYTDVLLPQFGGNPNDECGPPNNVEDGNYDDVDLADFDSDGDLDFAVAQYDDCGRNFLVENRTIDGKGGTPRTFEICGVSPDELPAEFTHSVSFGEVNADGAIDILLANRFDSSRKPQIYLGSGAPCDFQPTPIELPSPGSFLNSPTTVADLRDLNGDGKTDVYIAQSVVSPPGSPRHGVYFHSGNNANPYPTFTPWPETAPFAETLYDARYQDLDDDGDLEIVVVNININEIGTRFDTEIHVATVSGSQLVDVSPQFLPSGLSGGIAVDTGDLDNDGDHDLVLGGISDDLSGIYSAAHVYENRTFTHLHDAVLASGTFLALKELRADTDLTIPSGGDVTLEAGETVVLGDGFTAAAGSELVVRNL